MRRFSALVAIVSMVLLAAHASAITNGQPDNGEHSSHSSGSRPN